MHRFDCKSINRKQSPVDVLKACKLSLFIDKKSKLNRTNMLKWCGWIIIFCICFIIKQIFKINCNFSNVFQCWKESGQTSVFSVVSSEQISEKFKGGNDIRKFETHGSTYNTNWYLRVCIVWIFDYAKILYHSLKKTKKHF